MQISYCVLFTLWALFSREVIACFWCSLSGHKSLLISILLPCRFWLIKFFACFLVRANDRHIIWRRFLSILFTLNFKRHTRNSAPIFLWCLGTLEKFSSHCRPNTGNILVKCLPSVCGMCSLRTMCSLWIGKGPGRQNVGWIQKPTAIFPVREWGDFKFRLYAGCSEHGYHEFCKFPQSGKSTFSTDHQSDPSLLWLSIVMTARGQIRKPVPQCTALTFSQLQSGKWGRTEMPVGTSVSLWLSQF